MLPTAGSTVAAEVVVVVVCVTVKATPDSVTKHVSSTLSFDQFYIQFPLQQFKKARQFLQLKIFIFVKWSSFQDKLSLNWVKIIGT